jgi:1-deoxy-D-xylulose-5-phosphate reductoisomerase
VAVEAFLERKIRFGDIAAVIEEVLAEHDAFEISDVETVVAADREARLKAERIVKTLC